MKYSTAPLLAAFCIATVLPSTALRAQETMPSAASASSVDSSMPKDGFRIRLQNGDEYKSEPGSVSLDPATARDGHIAPPLSSLPENGAALQRLRDSYAEAYRDAAASAKVGPHCATYCGRVMFVDFQDGDWGAFHGDGERGYITFTPHSGEQDHRALAAQHAHDIWVLAKLVAAVRANPDIPEDELTRVGGNDVKPPVVVYSAPAGAVTSDTIPPPPPPPAPPPGWKPPDVQYLTRTPPVYPGLAVLEGHAGTVTLVISIGHDGTPSDVRVERSSGHPELDQSALATARNWRFAFTNPSTTWAKVRAPVHFNLASVSRAIAQGVGWPVAYLHPRYVRSAEPFPFTTVEQALGAISLMAEPAKHSSRALTSFCITSRQGRPSECWMFLDLGAPDEVAIRYVFGGTALEPEVAVSALCKEGSTACGALMPQLLDGPFFATAAVRAQTAPVN